MTDSLMRNLNMQAVANLPIWLNMAGQVYSPSKVVLVGAGNGTGPLVQSLLGLKASPLHANMQAHLIEADPLALSQLAKKLDPESTWVLSQEAVLPDQTSIDADFNTYYQYSLGAESSLLPPGFLKSLWPNIQLRNKKSCANGILLSSLLPASWLMIDCLPVAQLIQGVNLDRVDVLMGRVVFDEIEKSPLGSSLFELDEKLSSQGFKLYACFTERNTSLGKALWLRDSAKQLEQAIAHSEQQAKQLEQEKSEVQQLTQFKAELQANLEAEVQSRVQEVQTLRLEKDALEHGKVSVQENLKAEINAKNALQVKIQELEQQQVEFVAKKLELEKVQEQTTQQIKELQDKLEQARVHSEQQAKQLDQEKAEIQQLTELKIELQTKLEAEVQSRAQDIQALRLEKEALDQNKTKLLVELDSLKVAFNELQQKFISVDQEKTQLTVDIQKYQNLFECQIYVDSESCHPISFNTKSDFISIDRQGQVKYDLPENVPAYLVSNESGDFEKGSDIIQLQLASDKAFEFKGYIQYEGVTSPVVWLFEYDETQKRIKSHTLQTQKGEFRTLLKTQAKSSNFAIGIRISGKGKIDPKNTYFKFANNLAIEVAEAIQQDEQRFDRKLSEVQANLQKQQKTQSQNNLKQIESFLRLQKYCGDSIVLPDMHGFPISPDLGIYIVRLIETGNYDAVIEFGSGVSTTLIALAIQKSSVTKGEAAIPCLSFEHLDTYLSATIQQLKNANLQKLVELVHAPLVENVGAHEAPTPYYDCRRSLQDLKESLNNPQPKLLVLVDGPPAATGPYARYPALDVVDSAFEGMAEVHYLMDDYIRQDERDIVALWEASLSKQNRLFQKQEFTKFEKQACLLIVEALKER